MLSITTKIEEDFYDIDLKGEIDIYTVDILKNAVDDLMKQERKDILFNLAQLEYIDSTGLGALIGIKGKYEDIKLKITNLRPNVKRLFEITGLIKIFIVQ